MTTALKNTTEKKSSEPKKIKIKIVDRHISAVDDSFQKCKLDNATFGVINYNTATTSRADNPHKVDLEWASFLSTYEKNNSCKIMTSISSIQTNEDENEDENETENENDKEKCGVSAQTENENNVGNGIGNTDYELTISTKTKILFINTPVDIHSLFWKIPVVNYYEQTEGVVKKQIKIVSKTKEEYEEYREKTASLTCRYKENFIKQIDNPAARSIKFKDERKLTIGIAKKDILNNKLRIKNTFYNCFVVIIRIYHGDVFKEIHTKIFNTGKIEIPGVLTEDILNIVKQKILIIIDNPAIEFVESDTSNNILINSNFNCGYYVNRDSLHNVLRSKKYELEAVYDPCSYPAVKCKFYFNNELGFDHETQNGRIVDEDMKMKMTELGETKKYTEISFMIFRTGSGLIIGNCSDEMIYYIFEFIKRILNNEKHLICESNEPVVIKQKPVRTRNITLKITKDCNNKIHATSI